MDRWVDCPPNGLGEMGGAYSCYPLPPCPATTRDGEYPPNFTVLGKILWEACWHRHSLLSSGLLTCSLRGYLTAKPGVTCLFTQSYSRVIQGLAKPKVTQMLLTTKPSATH